MTDVSGFGTEAISTQGKLCNYMHLEHLLKSTSTFV